VKEKPDGTSEERAGFQGEANMRIEPFGGYEPKKSARGP